MYFHAIDNSFKEGEERIPIEKISTLRGSREGVRYIILHRREESIGHTYTITEVVAFLFLGQYRIQHRTLDTKNRYYREVRILTIIVAVRYI